MKQSGTGPLIYPKGKGGFFARFSERLSKLPTIAKVGAVICSILIAGVTAAFVKYSQQQIPERAAPTFVGAPPEHVFVHYRNRMNQCFIDLDFDSLVALGNVASEDTPPPRLVAPPYYCDTIADMFYLRSLGYLYGRKPDRYLHARFSADTCLLYNKDHRYAPYLIERIDSLEGWGPSVYGPTPSTYRIDPAQPKPLLPAGILIPGHIGGSGIVLPPPQTQVTPNTPGNNNRPTVPGPASAIGVPAVPPDSQPGVQHAGQPSADDSLGSIVAADDSVTSHLGRMYADTLTVLVIHRGVDPCEIATRCDSSSGEKHAKPIWNRGPNVILANGTTPFRVARESVNRLRNGQADSLDDRTPTIFPLRPEIVIPDPAENLLDLPLFETVVATDDQRQDSPRVQFTADDYQDEGSNAASSDYPSDDRGPASAGFGDPGVQQYGGEGVSADAPAGRRRLYPWFNHGEAHHSFALGLGMVSQGDASVTLHSNDFFTYITSDQARKRPVGVANVYARRVMDEAQYWGSNATYDYILGLALLFIGDGDPQRAKEKFENVLRSTENEGSRFEYETLYLLAYCQYTSKDYRECEQTLDAMILPDGLRQHAPYVKHLRKLLPDPISAPSILVDKPPPGGPQLAAGSVNKH